MIHTISVPENGTTCCKNGASFFGLKSATIRECASWNTRINETMHYYGRETLKEQNLRRLETELALLKAISHLPDTPECNLVRELAIDYQDANRELVIALQARAYNLLKGTIPTGD